MDFLVVPTVTGRLLYVLIVMTPERRKVVHFNVTESPTAEWTAQQVVNAFPYDTVPSICCAIEIRSMDWLSCAESRAWV